MHCLTQDVKRVSEHEGVFIDVQPTVHCTRIYTDIQLSKELPHHKTCRSGQVLQHKERSQEEVRLCNERQGEIAEKSMRTQVTMCDK